VDAAGYVLARGRRRTHLLGIIISRFLLPTTWMEDGRVAIVMAHETRIRSNPRHAGKLRFVGEWTGDWRLEQAEQAPMRFRDPRLPLDEGNTFEGSRHD
jgi:hypothetical protein